MLQDLKEIARFLVDAFDVDMQLYMGKAMRQLKDTPTGMKFVAWAESNPMAFEALLRLISASAQRIPKDKSLLMQAVLDQLGRLPVEIHRSIIEDNNESLLTSQEKIPLVAEDFRKRYEEALEGLSDELLEQIARLSHSKILEWVNSPAKLRPYLLKKWKEEKPHIPSNFLKSVEQHPAVQNFMIERLEKKCQDMERRKVPGVNKIREDLEQIKERERIKRQGGVLL
ncbi:MAG: hypothetical protein V2A53_08900 [bacterium]